MVAEDDLEGASHYSLDLTNPDELSKEEREYMIALHELGEEEAARRLSRHELCWIIVASIAVAAYFALIGWLVIKGIDSASEMEYD